MTAKITLTWDNDSRDHVDQIVYRSTETFTVDNLPTILDRVGRDTRELIDTDIVTGTNYFYAVASENNVGEVFLSSVITVTAGEALPDPLPTVLGEPYGGGFYAGDIEYTDGQWYKLIVADKGADISSTNSRWKTSNTDTPGTYHLTDGMANTASMSAAGIGLHPAANHCVNHLGGDNSDWYMPAKDELNVIYQNLSFSHPNCPPDFKTGGSQAFINNWYWSSTAYSSGNGWIQNFDNGMHIANTKTISNCRVRPVRRIPFNP